MLRLQNYSMYSLKFNFMKLEYIFKLHKTDICVYLSASVGSEGISLREMVGSRTSWSIFLYLRLGIDLQACNFRMNTFVTLRRRRSIECPWVDFVHREDVTNVDRFLSNPPSQETKIQKYKKTKRQKDRNRERLKDKCWTARSMERSIFFSS